MTGSSPQPPERSARFFTNVLWNWLGVAVMLLTGFVLSPVIIRRVGHDGYGVWALAFSLIEYYWLLDLGLRRATSKYSAHYKATGEPERINEVVNTGLAYFAGVAALVAAATFLFAPRAWQYFNVSPQHRDEFSFLVIVIGLSWAMGSVFNVFGACLEGFQRFDLSSRIWIAVTGVRAGGCLLLLWMGYGLKAMGALVVAAQIFGYAYSFLAFRRVFPERRFSLSLARFSMLRQLAVYGMHAFVAVVASQLLNQSVPVLIGHFLPVAFIGYYTVPQRLLSYAAEIVERVGMVTNTSAAEMWARGDIESLSRLGMYANRYCMVMFMPVVVVILGWGPELLRVWVGPEFARYAAPLLPAFLLSTTIVSAGQYNSGSLLFGVGRHGGYSKWMLAEALLNVAGMIYLLPRHGILAAAWLAAILMSLNRGVLTAWLVCHHLRFPLAKYLSAIYLRPALAAVPVLALAWWLKSSWLPGRNWAELFAAAALVAGTYYPLAFGLCIRPQDRTVILTWLSNRSARLRNFRAAAEPAVVRE